MVRGNVIPQPAIPILDIGGLGRIPLVGGFLREIGAEDAVNCLPVGTPTRHQMP